MHSGWPTEDNRFIVVHDELDELRRSLNTHIYTLDIARSARAEPRDFVHRAADLHRSQRLHARQSLLRVSLQARPGDLRPDESDALTEIGSFDTYLSPSANTAGTDGAWGVYPFLPSGTILVSDIENGLFLLKRNETLPPPTTPPSGNPPPPRAGGGGGGGALELPVLILLAGFAMLRARKYWA